MYIVYCTCIVGHTVFNTHVHFESWDKLDQQWLVCVCHWEYILSQINKVNAVSDTIIIINCATGIKRELCSAKKEVIWAYCASYKHVTSSVISIDKQRH